jgi:hypothetical protein
LASKSLGRFVSGLTSKSLGQFSPVWAQNWWQRFSPVWPQNRWRWFLPVWPQNQWWRVSWFGPQNWHLRFGDLSLKITKTVSWFGPQNQAGYGLLVAPQNRRRMKTAWVIHRDLSACFVWKQVRLEFSSLTSRLVEARRRWCTWHHHGGYESS